MSCSKSYRPKLFRSMSEKKMSDAFSGLNLCRRKVAFSTILFFLEQNRKNYFFRSFIRPYQSLFVRSLSLCFVFFFIFCQFFFVWKHFVIFFLSRKLQLQRIKFFLYYFIFYLIKLLVWKFSFLFSLRLFLFCKLEVGWWFLEKLSNFHPKSFGFPAEFSVSEKNPSTVDCSFRSFQTLARRRSRWLRRRRRDDCVVTQVMTLWMLTPVTRRRRRR